MENLTFNPNLCYARKNQKTGFHIQCPFNKKLGHYCGKHKNYLAKNLIPINVIPNDDNTNNNKTEKNLLVEKQKNQINTESSDNNNNNHIGNTKRISLKNKIKNIIDVELTEGQGEIEAEAEEGIQKSSGKFTKKKNMYVIKPYDYHKICKSTLTLIDYLYDKDLKYSNTYIKKSYKYYDLGKFSAKRKRAYTKEEKSAEIKLFKNKLQFFFETLLISYINIEKIVFLQTKIRHYIKEKEVRIHGPAINNRKICNNHTDFYSFDDIKDIPNKFFFSYRDNDGFVYGFHIESFINLISNDTEPTNPYNRVVISKKIKDTAIQIWQDLNKKKDVPNYTSNNVSGRDLRHQVRNKCLTVLQKMDMFGYQTKIDWIMDLPIVRVRQLFRSIRNYWSFKAGLTQEVKNRIYPNGNPIQNINIRNIERSLNRYTVIGTVLDLMNMIVTSGVTNDDQNQGCILLLLAMNDVNREVGRCNSWLI